MGVDEVGRGCLAGPVVAGAVLLKRRITGVRDSKKLTKQQREEMDLVIRARAVAFGLGWASVDEINQFGLTEAVRLAMRRAVAAIREPYDELVIDGNHNFLKELPRSRCLIKADDKVCAVGAASIIAKVARDAFMSRIAQNYPAYQFEKHVGYGTAVHRAALLAQGSCVLHRTGFAPVRAVTAV